MMHEVEGHLKFDRINFSYIDEEPVLNDINFEVNAGQTLALVGATGSGKSSIINLILRFYNVDSGTILLDGKDIMQYNIQSLRSHVALVLQDVFLFSDTIYNNIVLDKEIPIKEVRDAAKAIGLEGFIEQLPGGYHYNVGRKRCYVVSRSATINSFFTCLCM